VSLVAVRPPAGSRFEHHVVHLDQVAIALITNQHDQILMLWRHRFAVDRWGYELLGGLVEPGEDPATTAAREAEEESGWQPISTPAHLISFQPLPGIIDSPVHVYLWCNAEKVCEPTDPDEAGRLEWIDIKRLPRLVQDGQLLGAGTLVAVLHYLAVHRQ
jgi:8-oxo-dGTP pyrophosphatase MutT (NUDIX family)